MGAGSSRYFGRAKTHAQWLWAGAVANFERVWWLTDKTKEQRAA